MRRGEAVHCGRLRKGERKLVSESLRDCGMGAGIRNVAG